MSRKKDEKLTLRLSQGGAQPYPLRFVLLTLS